MKSLTTCLSTAMLLISGSAMAQLPPPMPPKAPDDAKAHCVADAKKAGLSGKELEDFVKQCISRSGAPEGTK